MLERLTTTLRNIPPSVINEWLVPFAESGGWPITDANPWDRTKTGEQLEFWNDANWELQTINILDLNYSNQHSRTIRGLISAYRDGEENEYWRHLGEDGKRRFSRLLIYLVQNRVFPVAPILVLTNEGQYEVLDGAHRFTAYFAAQQTFQESQVADGATNAEISSKLGIESIQLPYSEQEGWVCTPDWNNSPRTQTRRYLARLGIDIN